ALDRGEQVGRENQYAPLGKERVHFLVQTLHAGSARNERVDRLALRAVLRLRHREAAVMTDEGAAEAVIDQPRVAVRAVEAEAAGPAQRKRRIAATIEEQQRLFAPLECVVHRLGEARRDEAAARRAFALQVDWFDRRKALAAEALRQCKAPVAPAPRV